MTADQRRRLELAARVWAATKPTDDAIDRDVMRVARRIRAPKRRDPFRRFIAFLIAIVSFGSALAFAATRLPAVTELIASVDNAEPPVLQRSVGRRRGSDGRAASEAATPALAGAQSATDTAAAAESSHVHRTAAQPSAAPASVRRQRAAPSSQGLREHHVPVHEPALSSDQARAAAAAAAGDAEKAKSAKPAADAELEQSRLWRQVSEGLAGGNTALATVALQKLAFSGSDKTRAKARLGLVQLAVSDGDCAVARRLAVGLAELPGADPGVVVRALDAARRCKP
jgi:hypothetical protein